MSNEHVHNGTVPQGLLFKVNGVSPSSPVYGSLTVIMLLLCIGFIVAWLLIVLWLVIKRLPALLRPAKPPPAPKRKQKRGSPGSPRLRVMSESEHKADAGVRDTVAMMAPLLGPFRLNLKVGHWIATLALATSLLRGIR